MPYYSGVSGELYVDGQRAARVRNWSLSVSTGTLDATSLGDNNRVITEGITSTTGAASLWYYAVDPRDTTTNSASVLLNKLVKARLSGAGSEGVSADTERVSISLNVADGTAGGKGITGECIITSASMAMGVGEVLAADVAFEFNGAPTGVNI